MSELPLDCWCEVISFFEDVNDVISLVLVIRNLWNHVQFVHPFCTKNIIFNLFSLPQKNQSYWVRNLNCDSRKFLKFEGKISEHFKIGLSKLNQERENKFKKYTGFETVQSFLDSLFSSFSQTKEISVHFNFKLGSSVLHFPTNNNIRVLSFEQAICDSLRIACRNENEIVELRLRNFITVNYENYEPEDFPNKLSVEWDRCLPKLKVLSLQNWFISTQLNDNKFDELESLELKNVLFRQNELFSFKNLKSLFLSDNSISLTKSLKNLEELRVLNISFGNSRNDQTIDFEIQCLPNLETLKIELKESSSLLHNRSFDSVMELKELPNLKDLRLVNLRIPVRFSIFSLMNIYLLNCTDVDLSEKEQFFNLTSFSFSSNVSVLGPNLFHCIYESKKLSNLRYSCSPFGQYIPCSFAGLSELIHLEIHKSNVFCEFVKDCTKLESLSIVPIRKFEAFDVPMLVSLHLEFNMNLDSFGDLAKILNHFSHCEHLKHLGIFRTSFVPVHQSSSKIDRNLSSRIEVMKVGIVNKYEFDGIELLKQSLEPKLTKFVVQGEIDVSVDVQNLPNLECIIFDNTTIPSFSSTPPRKVVVRNCSSLSLVEISEFSCWEEVNVFVLENLISLKNLKISSTFFLSQFTFTNVPLERLEIKITTGRENIEITDKDFPFLKELTIIDEQPVEQPPVSDSPLMHSILLGMAKLAQDLKGFMRIGKISGLKDLRNINIFGTIHITHPLFLEVEGIDYECVEVFIMKGRFQKDINSLEVEKRMKFGEYIDVYCSEKHKMKKKMFFVE